MGDLGPRTGSAEDAAERPAGTNSLFHRPVVLLLAFYAAGVLWGLIRPPFWSGSGLPLLLVLLLLITYRLACSLDRRRAASLLLAAVFLPLGLFYASARDHMFPPELAPRLGTRVEADLRVTGPPQYLWDAWRVPVEFYSIAGEPAALSGRIRFYGGTAAEAPLKYGDTARFTGRLTMGEQDLQISGGVGAAEITGRRANPFFAWLYRERERCQKILSRLYSEESSGLLAAMLTGDRGGLSGPMVEEFRETGLAHLLAVSGLHVMAVIATIYLLLRWAGLRRRSRAAFSLGATILFVLFTGAPVSAVRAGVMVGLYLLGEILDRPRDIYQTLAAAAFLTLLFDPREILTAGFQLSYGVTFALVYLTPFLESILFFVTDRYRVRTVVAASIAAQLTAAPLLIAHFNYVSLIGLFANLAAAPLFVLIVPLGVLSWILGGLWLWLGAPVAAVNEILLRVVFWVGAAGSSVPYAALNVPALPVTAVLLFFLLLLLLPRLGRSRWDQRAGVVVLLLLIARTLLFVDSLYPDHVTAYFLDVGQGEAILITTPRREHLLVDGGPSLFRLRRDLRALGVNRLRGVLLSHPHADHVRGLVGLEDVARIDRIILGREDEDTPNPEAIEAWITSREEQGTAVLRLARGRHELDFFSIPLEVFAVEGQFTERYHDEDAASNNRSLIVRLSDPDGSSLLMTGDLEEEGEAALITLAGGSGRDLSSEVYKAAHHGAVHSNRPELLDLIAPKMVVLSVGANNYGHPSEVFLERLSERRLPLYRTDHSGTLRVELAPVPRVSPAAIP